MCLYKEIKLLTHYFPNFRNPERQANMCILFLHFGRKTTNLSSQIDENEYKFLEK